MQTIKELSFQAIKNLYQGLPYKENNYNILCEIFQEKFLPMPDAIIDLLREPTEVLHEEGSYRNLLQLLNENNNFGGDFSIKRELQDLLGLDASNKADIEIDIKPTRNWLYRDDFTRVTTPDNGRIYKTNDGLAFSYPGVTSIHAAVEPFDPTLWINKIKRENPDWNEQQINDFMEETRISAARRGSQMHEAIEQYLFDRVNFSLEQCGKEGLPYFQQILQFLRYQVDKVLAIEPFVYWDMEKVTGYKGAGALGYIDLVGIKDGKVVIYDWKTSNKKKNPSWITNYFIQIAAYSAMLYQTYGIKAESAIIVIATDKANVQPQVFNLSRDDIGNYLRMFIEEVQTYYQMKENV